MGRINVKDVEAVAQFTRDFSICVEGLMFAASQASVEVVEACAWMENTIEAAQEALKEARRVLEDREDALRNCEAQEDDDYIPDCSAEEYAIQDAENEVKMWETRVCRLTELGASLARRKRFVLEEVSNLRRKVGQAGEGGRVFLAEQLRVMNDILRMNIPRS
jgi:hypothetical protein